jgi:hypothetical protein
LIRYVHRNPIETGHVPSVAKLARYPWTGHAALMGRLAPPGFQSIREVLELFAACPRVARMRLLDWMHAAPHPQPLRSESMNELIVRVCTELGVDPEEVRSGRRTWPVARARAAIAVQARRELGLPTRTIARALGVSRQALWSRLDGRCRLKG